MSTVCSSFVHALQSCFGLSVRITNCEVLHGGCIGIIKRITLSDNTSLIIKQNTRVPFDSALALCCTEAVGLAHLGATDTIKVPKVHAIFKGVSDGDDRAVRSCDGMPAIEHAHPGMILEYIPAGSIPKHFWNTFGTQLAQLHNYATDDYFGFSQNNFIGSTPQINTSERSWVTFFATQRLWYQCTLAKKQGHLNIDVLKRVERLCASLSLYIDEPACPSLLHGDLWSGNYLCALDGSPVIIDPAVYYGHAEADLAMTELFGGYPKEFYRAYNAVRTIEKEYHTRKYLYNLYHLLNHLNLFGDAYLGQVLNTLRRFT